LPISTAGARPAGFSIFGFRFSIGTAPAGPDAAQPFNRKSKIKNQKWLAAGLLALVALAGCDQAAWIGYKVLKPIVPEEKVKAEFEFHGKSLLVLVDMHDPDLAARFPRLQPSLADEIGSVLARNKAVGPVVPGHSVETARRTQRDFIRLSVVEVGKSFNVDYVLHLVVYDFRIRETPSSMVLDGFAEGTVRIVSPESGEQVWPVLASAREVSARTVPGVETVDDPQELEKVLMEGWADKIARHFFTYKVDDLPLRPKVE
jgi:hypothetical protein